MAIEKKRFTRVQTADGFDIAIIGGGPVGLVASRLLSKFRIRHLLAEQEIAPAEHPKAHFWLKRRGERISVLDLT
jgi:2-polyprenyl-6-methoxyphenol hydroxylase-like FAD-dependent oxidoreductase